MADPQEFHLTKRDFIALNDLLKVLHLVGTGGEANTRISAGEAFVNGEAELRKRKKLRSGDLVEFDGAQIVIR